MSRDALLYVADIVSAGEAIGRYIDGVCADTAYINTRLARMALVGVPTDALKKICGIAP